ncbi:MAG: InlB B-repeat-containing protein, partial [Lachnospiraceae bacterium]|nr:InlB B-repeat-containing protein [Lachnospiraceae bacterium]
GSQVLTSLPEAVRDNYNFDGWFTTASGGDKITTAYAFSSDMTVYAHWAYIPPTPRTYTITFDPNGGSVSPKSKTTGTDGKLASLPTPTREGYSFNGWFTAKDGGDQVTTSTVFGSDTTVYAHWKETPEPDPDPKPDPKPDTPKETPIMVSDNKPMNVSTEPKGDFRITYAHDIPFYGKGKVTPDYFGGITVSYNNTEYKVSAIKVNKKKHYMQITALEGNDKKLNKAVKKATKGKKKGLTFKTNPFYIRNTDKDLIVLKEKKNGDVKSVKIKINGKYYKAKKGKEWKYDKDTKTVTFLGDNLDGGYTKP